MVWTVRTCPPELLITGVTHSYLSTAGPGPPKLVSATDDAQKLFILVLLIAGLVPLLRDILVTLIEGTV